MARIPDVVDSLPKSKVLAGPTKSDSLGTLTLKGKTFSPLLDLSEFLRLLVIGLVTLYFCFLNENFITHSCAFVALIFGIYEFCNLTSRPDIMSTVEVEFGGA